MQALFLCYAPTHDVAPRAYLFFGAIGVNTRTLG